FSSRRRHTRFSRDWSSDVCSSDLRYVTYASTIKDMLQRVQVRATESAAGKSTADLAKVQGAHMEADAQAKALAAAQEEAKKKGQIGRASCRERVEMAVVGVALKKR